MHNMFFNCSSLKELNLNNFNTNNVTDMNGMFYACSEELIKIPYLLLTGFISISINKNSS